MRNGCMSIVALVLILFCAAADGDGPSAATRPTIHVAHAGLLKLAWQLAVPTGTFTDRSVFETIDLLHKQDIHHLELTPGQPLDAGMPGVQAGQKMSAESVAALLTKLKAVHMDVVSFGPVDLGPDDTSARVVFAFAKRIKAKNIVASPPVDTLPRLDKLATEYGVSLAIDNSADNPAYRMPSDLLTAIAPRSPRIGSDDDLLQWHRAGVDPLAATQQLRGHILQIRVGEGGNLQPVLAELKSQKFKGIITVAAAPGGGEDEINRFVTLINTLSDVVTKVVADTK